MATGKNKSPGGVYQWEGVQQKKRTEGVCAGCVLYPYIKIEE
jgi:hypothetical protein